MSPVEPIKRYGQWRFTATETLKWVRSYAACGYAALVIRGKGSL